MENQAKTGPKDFFLWLASIAALYVSVISFVALWFEFINRMFGNDPFGYIDPLGAGIRIAVASLIIIFPLYIWFTRMLHQDIRINPAKKEIWVRKWLLVLTLFISGIVLIVDLIVLINTFLGGEELTAAFILKVLTVLIVVGGAFLYYLNEIKGTWEREEGKSKIIGIVVSVIVLASVIGAFFIVGSPQTLREIRYDQQKIGDLQQIQSQVTNFFQQKEVIPASLEELEDPLIGFRVPEDPQSAEGEQYVYTYRKLERYTFEICAVFNQPSPQTGKSSAREIYYEPYGLDNFFEHGVGEECFERTIDPDKFPSFKPALVR
jgi:hypothetical protein